MHTCIAQTSKVLIFNGKLVCQTYDRFYEKKVTRNTVFFSLANSYNSYLFYNIKIFKNFMALFLWMGFKYLQITEQSQ